MLALRHAFRTLAKTPFVTTVAVLSLALGIGANTAIFSIFDSLLLRLLPVEDPKSLVSIKDEAPRSGSVSTSNAGNDEYVFSYPMLRDMQKLNHLFTGILGYRSQGANISFRNQNLNTTALLVTGNYFEVLGVKPLIGRLLTEADDTTYGAHNVVVLAHSYWQERFGGNPSVLNETMLVNGSPMTVIGIAPPGFTGLSLGPRPAVFVPITMKAALTPSWKGFENHLSYWIYMMARLKPGADIRQAGQAINVGYRGLIQEEVALQRGASPRYLERFKKKELKLESGGKGQSSIDDEAETPVLLLFAITGSVLLIACANVANLLLARAAGRSKEIAIRLSVGASRAQLVRQLLTESCLLALMGGFAGLVVAAWTLDGIRSFMPADAIHLIDTNLDFRLMLFNTLLSLVTGVLFGLFPAIQSTRPDLAPALKDTAGQSSGTSAAAVFRRALVVGQIAISTLLLVCAGLFTASLAKIMRVDLGLRSDNMVTFGISPELSHYSPERSAGFFERLEDAIGAIPGVTMVSGSLVSLLAGNNWGGNVTVEGFQTGPDTDTHSMFNAVGPGYFRTMGMPLVAGREFTRADHKGAPNVVVVNEAFVRKFIPGGNAIGKRMMQGTGTPDIEIVGVAKDAKYSDVKRAAPPLYMVPFRQSPRGFLNYYVRCASDPRQVMPAIRRAVASIDPNIPIEELKTLEAQVRENIFADRMITTLALSFAILATLLAAVGLYGVLAYMMSRRTREIGIRMALGATSSAVRNLVLREVVWLLAIGAGVGLPAAIGLAKFAESLLYQMKAADPFVSLAATLAVAAVSLTAGYIPAWRATRIDPMNALRHE